MKKFVTALLLSVLLTTGCSSQKGTTIVRTRNLKGRLVTDEMRSNSNRTNNSVRP